MFRVFEYCLWAQANPFVEPTCVKYYMVAAMLLVNKLWDCWSSTPLQRDAKLLLSTVGRRSSTPVLWHAEVLPLHCGTPKFYQPFSIHCGTVKLYPTTASQLNYWRNKLHVPLTHWTSTTALTKHSLMAANLGVTPPDPFPFSKPEGWTRWIQRFERFRVASKLNEEGDEAQLNMLIYCMGDRADDILRPFNMQRGDLDLQHSQKKFCPTKKHHYWTCPVQLRWWLPKRLINYSWASAARKSCCKLLQDTS